jgi:hypothetical protein
MDAFFTTPSASIQVHDVNLAEEMIGRGPAGVVDCMQEEISCLRMLLCGQILALPLRCAGAESVFDAGRYFLTR